MNNVFNEIMAGLDDVIAHAKGEPPRLLNTSRFPSVTRSNALSGRNISRWSLSKKPVTQFI